MKYLFIIFLLLGCRNGQKKVLIPDHRGSNVESIDRRDMVTIDVHDPYETGKDTVRLNKVMNHIYNFPEVQELDNRISNNSKATHGVAIMVQDNFSGDTAYYNFIVGDNSKKDKFDNAFNFLLVKKTGEIKAYDAATDSIMTLKQWRVTSKRQP